jgi:hypothetical protein
MAEPAGSGRRRDVPAPAEIPTLLFTFRSSAKQYGRYKSHVREEPPFDLLPRRLAGSPPAVATPRVGHRRPRRWSKRYSAVCIGEKDRQIRPQMKCPPSSGHVHAAALAKSAAGGNWRPNGRTVCPGFGR